MAKLLTNEMEIVMLITIPESEEAPCLCSNCVAEAERVEALKTAAVN